MLKYLQAMRSTCATLSLQLSNSSCGLIALELADGDLAHRHGTHPLRDLKSGDIVVFKTLRENAESGSDAKIFNFCHKAQKLLRYISRDSGGSSDSNHTKYINYGCEIREKIPIIFP
jgi:hypothetical protein